MCKLCSTSRTSLGDSCEGRGKERRGGLACFCFVRSTASNLSTLLECSVLALQTRSIWNPRHHRRARARARRVRGEETGRALPPSLDSLAHKLSVRWDGWKCFRDELLNTVRRYAGGWHARIRLEELGDSSGGEREGGRGALAGVAWLGKWGGGRAGVGSGELLASCWGKGRGRCWRLLVGIGGLPGLLGWIGLTAGALQGSGSSA